MRFSGSKRKHYCVVPYKRTPYKYFLSRRELIALRLATGLRHDLSEVM